MRTSTLFDSQQYSIFVISDQLYSKIYKELKKIHEEVDYKSIFYLCYCIEEGGTIISNKIKYTYSWLASKNGGRYTSICLSILTRGSQKLWEKVMDII